MAFKAFAQPQKLGLAFFDGEFELIFFENSFEVSRAFITKNIVTVLGAYIGIISYVV
jgi:hypothetical protein